jgi:outer membrane biosynthesis protein TonB
MAEQQRARQLSEQRLAEERAREAAARQQAAELARQRAAEAEAARQLARQDSVPARPSAEPGNDPVRADRGAGPGADAGTGMGAGAGSRGQPGRDFGSRARELLRGIDIAKAVPPAIRAAQQAQQAVRRALADAARRDVPLRLYLDSVRQKIERNAIVSKMQLSSGTVHTDPVVSIAIRSDGSIEDVTILRSSGRPDIDEVVRRIVSLNARYSAFPPNVAANYDVIELRRIWTFAEVLRLVEEVR